MNGFRALIPDRSSIVPRSAAAACSLPSRSRSGSASRRERRLGAQRLHAEWLERRLALAATPTAAVTAPDGFLGTAVPISVTFDNTGTDIGYGPFVDVVMPASGDAPPAPANGISFQPGSASFLGIPLQSTVLTFGPTGRLQHPFAKKPDGTPVVVTGKAGDELVVFRLPFGSYGPDQPAADIRFNGLISDLAQPVNSYDITATGGFQYQADAAGNPTIDVAALGATATDPVEPRLFTIEKDSDAPEDETATGPNFRHTYTVTVSVAPRQKLTNFSVSDVLPGNVQFVALTSATANGATVVTPTSTPSTTVPGGVLAYEFDQVVGTGGADVVLTYTFFIPEYDALGADVIPLATGGTAAAKNTVGGAGTWQSLNPNFPLPQFVVGDPVSYTVTGKTLALQKSASPSQNARAGDTVTYTLSFQLSDYFALGGFVIDDLLSDGQDFDASFTPTLAFIQKGQTFPAQPFAPANFIVDATNPNGTTAVEFDVAAQLAARGLATGGTILGAGIGNGGTGGPDPTPLPGGPGTTGTITFRTTIRNTYRATGDDVVQGDVLGDTATTDGAVLDFANLAPSGSTFSDGSSATVTLAQGVVEKVVHAVNGAPVTGIPVVAPGDEVTFRLTYSLPFSSIGQYTLTDFLPLPIFEAAPLVFAGGPSSVLPGTGQWSFGPRDTFSQPDPPDIGGPFPGTSFNVAANSVTWNFGTFEDDQNRPAVTDIFFTVKATNRPFADGLLLTNEVEQREVTTDGRTLSTVDIAQVQVAEPSLGITKGVVATTNAAGVFSPTPSAPAGVTFAAPGSTPSFTGVVTSGGLATTPIVAALSNVGATDVVTFAIVIENTGRSSDGAFDVTFRDTFDATKLQIPAGGLNLQVRDGAGTPLAFTSLGGGLFDPTGGIELVDGATVGSLGPGKTTAGTVINTGTNIAVVTYDLQLLPNVRPLDVIPNTATVTNYASEAGGPNFVPGGLSDKTTVTVASPNVTKTLVTTSIVNPNNTASQAVIGELATYTITVRVPQGEMPTAQVIDSMPTGLAYVRTVSAVNNSPATLTIPNLANAPTVTASGRTITYDLGTIVNTDTDPTTAETFTITIEAVVLNTTGNVRGTTLVNQARARWNAGANQTSLVSSGAVTVIEPTLTVAKTASPTTGQAGDTITYTILVSNPTGTNRTDAFEATLADAVPAGVTYVPGSWQHVGGAAPTTIGDAGPLTAAWTTFSLGATSTLTFRATLDRSVTPAQQLVNEADVAWTSLPGDPGQISPFNDTSFERTGSGSTTQGQRNDYTATAAAVVTIVSPTIVKSLVSTSIDNANNTRTQAVIGETAVYRLTVTVPQGTMPAATIVDTLPAGMAFVEVVGTPIVGAGVTIQNADWFTSPGNLTVGPGGQSLTFGLGTVTNDDTDSGVNETIVVDIRAVVLNVSANTSGTSLVNQARATWNAGANQTPQVAAEAVTVIEPDLTVGKTVVVGAGGGNVGDPVTYTIVVRHAPGSDTDAFDVTLADAIPSQVVAPTLVSVVDSAGLVTAANFSVAGQTLTTTGAGFAFAKVPGRTVTVTVAGTLAGISAAQTIANTATVQWTSLQGSPGQISPFNADSFERTGSGSTTQGQLNDYTTSGTASFTTNSADLAVTKTVDDARPNVGDTITYTVTLANNGPDTATGVKLTDTFPTSELRFVSATPSQGTYDAGTGVWDVGTVRAGAASAQTLRISAIVVAPAVAGAPPSTQTNVARVTASNEPDPVPGNNRAEVSETPQYADLAVTKTVNDATPNVGQSVTFTITLQNLGRDAATSVTIADPLPAGLRFVSASASQGAYASGSGIWTVGTLPANATVTLTVVAEVSRPAAGTAPQPMTNEASVATSNQYDPNHGNDKGRVTVTPLYADVAVTKTVNDPSPIIDDTVTYTIVVRNDGPNTAQNVSLAEVFPAAGLADILAGTPSQGSYDASAQVWTVGALPAGASATLTFTALTTLVGTFQNSATATTTTFDPNPGNDTGTAEIVTRPGGVITGTDFGCDSGPLVRVIDPRDGTLRAQFFAYEQSFRGGVRVYGGDVTGDGIPEIITAPGPGRPGEVRVFDRNGAPLPAYTFLPFGGRYVGGVEVAAGPVTAAGSVEIVAGQSRGQSLVRVFSVNPGAGVVSTPARQFQPFGTRFRGGVTVATADVGEFSGRRPVSPSPDGVAEIIVGSGAGIPAQVRAYNAVPRTPAVVGAFRTMGASRLGVSVAKLAGAAGAADRVLVSGGQRSGGQVQTWRFDRNRFVRDAAFTAFGGTSASIFAAALDAENIFTVEGLGGRTPGVRKNSAPAGGTSSEVPQTSGFVPPLRVSVLGR